MKKNAILIAGIMFVSGCASNYSQRAQYDATHDTSATVSSSYAYSDDISADSSKRGGSLDARGYDQDANNDEIEGTPDPLNPGRKADSSVRGGSIFAREREWNHDAEPSSGVRESDRHMKADSSIRGGSIEARGGREARGDYESDVNVHSESNLHSDYSHETRDDFGQGSSATWESDKEGSVRGSANWNASDDLMRDGLDSDADATASFEFDDSDLEMNNDASVGGAASAEIGEGSSSLSLEEKQSEEAAFGSSPGAQPNDLNSSENLEENISGEYEIETESSLETDQSDNASDTLSSSTTSASTTDIHHDEADLNALESAGAAASAEVGSNSSSEEFESNDPAMNRAGSPLGTAGGEPNFLYRDNRAHGVGSVTSGDFANAPVNQGALVTNDQLAQRVKARLTSESTGTHGLMSSEVARNIQVSAMNGEITLTGTVPSEKHKDLIEVRAREISGVRSVNNELMVTPEADAAARDISRGSDLEDVTSELQD